MDRHAGVPADTKNDEPQVKTVDDKGAPPVTTSEPAKPEGEVEDVPDPDEDDLDDLDDMLDEFSSVKLDAGKTAKSADAAPPTSAPKSPAPGPAPGTTDSQSTAEDGFSEDDFAKQLQAGMADLLGELEKSPEMQEQFEEMFKQMSAAAAADESATGTATDAASSSSKAPAGAGAADASFQETIRRTMERMQNSGDQATAAAASGGADDFMSEMLKQMSSGDFNAEGGEEEFSKMLMGMMEQLTNKEILYEPMKELDDKFPDWLENNKDKTPAEDLKRYEEQKSLVREIVAKFEESTYSDNNAADREYIVDRMQKMQAAGSPPSDLVGDMASAQEAFAGPDDQCNPQ
ncbi:Peroxisome chaperone and import receptor [Purpureocillium takamizusanense]|uniref:Peroxisome chaperone and import receptor n=1 Tax=Purpureocillium takamizusanense TaxID=2060973 RepID=A0A9Q8QAQ6_9HYPO|nr:Peroxisome chaperone and import receptor [Purpureocillium takamizusanense]UNI15837.1 Peroxisome chaperone and import receptor [Purpureocillium takamizusanense]